jgi:DNA repair protein RecN (Recombination protein N)
VLNYLSIKNYALIDTLEIEFDKGLSIITGETGAGKSILLGALSLILGQRADIAVLRDKEQKCVIEGNFSIANYQLSDFFKQNEIDYEPVAIIRREINPAGKSRAFINDTPVNLNVLSDLGMKLVDIHSQHQNLNLNESSFQLNIVDAFSGNMELLENYKLSFGDYQQVKRKLEMLISDASKSREDFEYFRFLFDELEKAKLQAEEQETLENELSTLNHAEEIQRGLSLIHNLLSENEESVIGGLNESFKAASQIGNYLPDLKTYSERLESAYLEIKDISSEIERKSGFIHFDPERAEFVNERLNLIYTLQKKHKVSSITELLQIRNDFFQRINDIESYDERLNELKAIFEKKKKELSQIALQMSDIRKKSFSSIEIFVIEQLKSLGMPNATFKISGEQYDDFTLNGFDKINFMFSANKNIEVQNISKVASGGEISRLMLSIKSLISKTAALPSIIFDEIDTGVSGDIAYKMGSIMLHMAGYMQVISITHLPQVAAKGNTHYKVYKEEGNEHTSTRIAKLNNDERLIEIAKMLSGENLSPQALENAKVLLQN